MNEIEFKQWPKTPRLFRDVVITEKIDGTNAAIGIVAVDRDGPEWLTSEAALVPTVSGDDFLVYAQSRSRIITPDADNHGFAAWVWENAPGLLADLGVGVHFGEWWGYGIQRGYGLPWKRFSLFNTTRHGGSEFETPQLGVVPVLYENTFNTLAVAEALNALHKHGSVAAPGFERPEGVVVFHTASGQVYKALIENDQLAKSDLAA